MNNQTVVITGASSGFGLMASLELAKRGFSVIATMRNLENRDTIITLCKQMGIKNKLSFYQLDVTSAQSVENFSVQLRKLPKIDILINNAGFALGGFCEEISISEYKEQFETNLFGVISVTQVVLPRMRKQGYGKIINVSSISGKMGFPGLSPYVASKHALEGWTECLRLEVKPFGIDVALIEPGSFQTNIWSQGKRIAERSKLHTSPYSSYMQSIENELEESQNSYGNPNVVASLIADLCSQKQWKKLRYPIGKGVRLNFFLKSIIPWNMWEKIFLNKLGMDKK
ncbi:SDR family oxidoreductase [Lederbergia lenta]|uniref:Short chain dehydrogenase n=1 Tax=Lederbergia lenta TaxID=1467 RepID=A0A2X4W244_LEDLE|nr:SDR family oxidoreductase [Lederbergia lenta]MCM3109482.1 SDR family oxidoreductase [Lederbergia lenta]MEC2324764.1 SDR family oxidoreductase [Lederbergia lenta]SQI58216.1 short chain dehydrogenase [Lederbergia lenta]